jgi:hypothetical protein
VKKLINTRRHQWHQSAKKKIASESLNGKIALNIERKYVGGNGVAKYQWRRTAKCSEGGEMAGRNSEIISQLI